MPMNELTHTHDDDNGRDDTDRESVEGTDPDLTVPGDSDVAASNGQGAHPGYADGALGGGAIGGAVDDGMGPDAAPDVAGEDAPVGPDDAEPLEEANRS